jgi:peroxiredoxin
VRELVQLAERKDEFARLGVSLYAIAVGPAAALAPLQEKLGAGMTLLADPEGRAVTAFGMLEGNGLARAATFLLDREGRVSYRWLAENYRKRPEPDDILAKARG